VRPLKKIPTRWSASLAYAIGLIATDGNLSKDGRHLVFVSKDLQLIKTLKKCLGIKSKICLKKSGFAPNKKYYFVQFGDVNFYRFLLSIGLLPAKSKILGPLSIPDNYFFDFLRGSFDGDGSFYSYWDKRWKSSFLFYLSFVSASLYHLAWLRKSIARFAKVRGHVDFSSGTIYQLKYAKREAGIILDKMYHSPRIPRLDRKFKKVQIALNTNLNNP
jgi:hypothetical protein